MLDRTGTVRVLDLGLARIVDASNPFSKTAAGRLTQSGMYMGTIDYMAPEQAEDSHSVDHRADIYSLGCTFYFLLTGREPFLGQNHFEANGGSPGARGPIAAGHPARRLAGTRGRIPEDDGQEARGPPSLDDRGDRAFAGVEARNRHERRGKWLRPANPGPAPEACNETPPKRASSPPPIIDSAIFARGVEGDGMLIDRELNLRDLVMDVRPEAGVTGDPCAVHDELEGVFSDQEFSLRELAMELREEAAPLAAPKPHPPRR